MDAKPRPRRLSHLFLAAVFALGAMLVLLVLIRLLEPSWPPKALCSTEACKEAREWLSWSFTVLVLLGGLYQYWRSQVWKRAEFVAEQMKEFFGLPRVQKALIMIDWSSRNINLFDSACTDAKQWPLVNRALQSRALLPHKIVNKTGASGEDASEVEDSDLAGYSRTEAAVRDSFDTFLDGLERFSAYIDSGLLSKRDLQPFLGYWVDDIASKTEDQPDGEWACSLLAYIDSYRYTGVQALFRVFGHDITLEGERFKEFLSQVANEETRQRLQDLVNKESGVDG